MNINAPKTRVVEVEFVVKSTPPNASVAVTRRLLVMSPGTKPPYHALSSTAGMKEIQGALCPTKGFVTIGNAIPTLTATTATPYGLNRDLSFSGITIQQDAVIAVTVSAAPTLSKTPGLIKNVAFVGNLTNPLHNLHASVISYLVSNIYGVLPGMQLPGASPW
jgi:hypothetical protein